MPKSLETLSEELAALPRFVVGGREFSMYLIGVHEPQLPTEHHLIVDFGARNEKEAFKGQLGLTPGAYSSQEVAKLAVSTIREIIEGHLPPGAKSLL